MGNTITTNIDFCTDQFIFLKILKLFTQIFICIFLLEIPRPPCLLKCDCFMINALKSVVKCYYSDVSFNKLVGEIPDDVSAKDMKYV